MATREQEVFSHDRVISPCAKSRRVVLAFELVVVLCSILEVGARDGRLVESLEGLVDVDGEQRVRLSEHVVPCPEKHIRLG